MKKKFPTSPGGSVIPGTWFWLQKLGDFVGEEEKKKKRRMTARRPVFIEKQYGLC